MSRPLEHRFVRQGLTLAAREWGDPEGLPVLALHGWLDNCGSFAVLAPLLIGVRLVALDLAGHGLSSHRSADATYNIWQDVGDVHAVAEQLGWENFALLGHSRGAMIATLT
ncbi:MAG: alpha/beta fold hydrolase, partial [Porticoccaceae bacterium]